MAEIPRALGFTDNQIQDALAVSTVGEEGNVINPFAAMGISGESGCFSPHLPPNLLLTSRYSTCPDHDYVEMLQGIALEKEGKRGLEVVQGNEREGKRARFQEGECLVRFCSLLLADTALHVQSTNRRLPLAMGGSAKGEIRRGRGLYCTCLGAG